MNNIKKLGLVGLLTLGSCKGSGLNEYDAAAVSALGYGGPVGDLASGIFGIAGNHQRDMEVAREGKTEVYVSGGEERRDEDGNENERNKFLTIEGYLVSPNGSNVISIARAKSLDIDVDENYSTEVYNLRLDQKEIEISGYTSSWDYLLDKMEDGTFSTEEFVIHYKKNDERKISTEILYGKRENRKGEDWVWIEDGREMVVGRKIGTGHIFSD